MTLLDRITADMKTAMKAKDTVTRDVLRMLRSELMQLDGGDPIAVLSKAVKTREEAAAEYDKAGRAELAAEERAQVDVVKRYLPEPLSEEAISDAAREVIAELGATTKREMGQVMKALLARHPGQIDGKVASRVVGGLLG